MLTSVQVHKRLLSSQCGLAFRSFTVCPLNPSIRPGWCVISPSALGLLSLGPLNSRGPHCQSLLWALSASVLSATQRVGAVVILLLGRKLRHKRFSDRPELSDRWECICACSLPLEPDL